MAAMAKLSDPMRGHLARVLDWEEAHVGFDKAVRGIPVRERGRKAAGFEHSPWQLVEHMRLAQKDLLDFCLNPRYVHELTWPDDYWPKDPVPPSASAWKRSLSDFKADRETLKRLASNSKVNLFATVPTGKGKQTYWRAIMLVIDHNAYHLGQLIATRRALGVWK